MIKKYDYIIVGSGPSSLTLAYHFSKLKKHCLILERDKDIGGCHSVRRVDNYFSEHGPRMYSNSFVNFINILNDMNINSNDIKDLERPL
jgi:phytoene dehydrogenase-like protein